MQTQVKSHLTRQAVLVCFSMSIMTYFGLLWPKTRILLGKEEDTFTIQPGFSITRTPKELKDFATSGQSGTEALSKFDKETIEKTEWCLAYDYDDPFLDLPMKNMTEDEAVHQRNENRKHAREALWRLALIAAFKYHLYLFWPYRCRANINLSNIWFWEPQITPFDDPEKDINDFLLGKPFWKKEIAKEELEAVKEIFIKVNRELNLAGNTQQILRNALNTAREAFHEGNMAYQLLLFTISLEDLFNDGHGDINHKICTRTACFLKKEYEDRNQVYADIKKMYKARSLVSHGHIRYHRLKQVKSVREARIIVREKVCEVLTKFLENKELWTVFDTDTAWKEFLRKLDLGEYNP